MRSRTAGGPVLYEALDRISMVIGYRFADRLYCGHAYGYTGEEEEGGRGGQEGPVGTVIWTVT